MVLAELRSDIQQKLCSSERLISILPCLNIRSFILLLINVLEPGLARFCFFHPVYLEFSCSSIPFYYDWIKAHLMLLSECMFIVLRAKCWVFVSFAYNTPAWNIVMTSPQTSSLFRSWYWLIYFHFVVLFGVWSCQWIEKRMQQTARSFSAILFLRKGYAIGPVVISKFGIISEVPSMLWFLIPPSFSVLSKTSVSDDIIVIFWNVKVALTLPSVYRVGIKYGIKQHIFETNKTIFIKNCM